MLRDLVLKNRSYRRYDQNAAVGRETLLELVELARISPSGGNRQGLKFFLSAGEANEKIFECLNWAGYLADWPGPCEGERPAAYIVVLADNEIGRGSETDAGIACQSMLLGAAEKGIGGCMFGSVNREKLRKNLSLPERFEIILVVALGIPVETVVIEELSEDGDIKYWRDENRVHHVPKRGLEEIIIN